MIKKILYPKTPRIGEKESYVEITEKLDGSNIGLFKMDNKLIIIQRNFIFEWNDLKKDEYEVTDKQLILWLMNNADEIHSKLYNKSGVFGEWLNTGKIIYDNTEIQKKFYIFAKARLSGESIETYKVINMFYTQELIPYAFNERILPENMAIVPLVTTLKKLPSVDELNVLYDEYILTVNKRKVEGFIINEKEQIKKYVRYKKGKFTPHRW